MNQTSQNECKTPEEHARHICQLRQQGKAGEVAELMKDPGHTCLNCNAVASDSHHLCNPSPFSRV